MFKYIQHRQKQWEKKWEEEERKIAEQAEREEARIAEMQAQARRQKLLIEQQEANRMRQQSLQRQQELAEEKWDKHFDSLLSDIKDQFQKNNNDKLDEIKVIIKTRQPSLRELDWESWLSDPLNQRLAVLDFEHAIELFKRDNLLAKRRRPARGRKKALEVNYALSFTGDTNTNTRRGDLVATDFNPDDFDLPARGFTISYWVRPDELGGDMFAIGRKAHNNARFTFGISTRKKGYFGVGANQSERLWETMLDTAGLDKATYLTLNGSDWELTIGKWYHFVVTYAGTNAGTNNMLRKIYMDGNQIWGTGVSDPTYKGNINWSDTGREMNHGLSFGMRAVRGSGTSTSYNNGWACGLDEVAIYNEEKDAAWISSVYNGGTGYNHKDSGGTGLVGYWRFNEGSGTRVEDLSGNGNHGLLTNDSHGDDGGAAFASGTPTWIKPPEGYDQ